MYHVKYLAINTQLENIHYYSTSIIERVLFKKFKRQSRYIWG